MPQADPNIVLNRIADALERLSPPPAETPDLSTGDAYHWNGQSIVLIRNFDPLPLNLLTGISDQKARLLENTIRHAKSAAAHDILLWGARGMGKSALVKAALAELQQSDQDIALVEAATDHLGTLPDLFELLGDTGRAFILFIDDIGFDGNGEQPRLLRSMLEGGATARPGNVRLYVTSNRRHIVPRQMSEQDDPVNPRDVLDDKLALSDRFGLRLGFHAASQQDYLAMISRYAGAYELEYDQDDALLWSNQRGGRSGRVAWQFIVEIAGQAGKTIG